MTNFFLNILFSVQFSSIKSYGHIGVVHQTHEVQFYSKSKSKCDTKFNIVLEVLFSSMSFV